MSFVCHYKKNTPGYPNPFEQCVDEIVGFLICPEAINLDSLIVNFSGFYSGAANDDIANNVYYSDSTGIYLATVYSGANLVSNSYARITLNQYASTSTSNVNIIDVSGYTNNKGTFSGAFKFPISSGDGNYSGLLYCKSGNYTGGAIINYTFKKFPQSTLNSIAWNTNNIVAELYNPNQYNSAIINLYTNTNTGENFTLHSSKTILPQSSDFYTVNIGSSFYFLRSEYLMPYSEDVITKDIASGGYPSTPTGITFNYEYLSTDSSQTPTLKVYITSGEEYKFTDIWAQYQSEFDSYWYDLGNSTLEQNSNFAKFIFSLPEGKYKVRASGRYSIDSTSYYSNIYTSDTIDLNNIILTAKTAQSKIGVDLYWNSTENNSYILYYSTSPTLSSPSTVDVGNNLYYFHDTSNYVNTVFYYKVCNTKSTPNCSSIVSSSGILKLSSPTLNISNSTANIGDTQFLTTVNYATSKDANALYISGYKYDSYNSSTTEIKKYVVGNDFFTDINYLYSDSHTLQYALAFINTKEQVTGNFSYFFITAPFIPSAPTSFTLTYDGNINLSWVDTMTDSFSKTTIKRVDPYGNIDYFYTTESSYIDEYFYLYPGTWTYSIYNSQISPSDDYITGFSAGMTKSYTIS